jgi:membrane protein YqaA with SNARE-associated domain
MDVLSIYLGLFALSFLAATILPAQSEAALFGLLVTGAYSTSALVVVASVGNVLGACANWGLGRLLTRLEHQPWFPVRRFGIARAEDWYRRYGRWSLLFSWAPVIGDPLTVVAGLLREPFPVFLALVAFAKVSRYLVVAAVQQGWF